MDGNWYRMIQIADSETIVYTTHIVIGVVRMGRWGPGGKSYGEQRRG